MDFPHTSVAGRLSATIDEQRRLQQLIGVELDDLRDMLAEPGREEDDAWILRVVERVDDHLAAQFALEEGDHYLDDVLERFPSWHPQLLHLREEHELLRRQLREVRTRAGAEQRNGGISKQGRRQLLGWIETYEEHQRRENLLILDAFTLDVGEGE